MCRLLIILRGENNNILLPDNFLAGFSILKTVMRVVFSFILLVLVLKLPAQKLDSIYFNLYTDSLKKGTYNYINVEGKYDNGRYLPLTNKDLKFSCADGVFEGNSLFLDTSFRNEKVKVQVVSLTDSALKKEIEIYIKRFESIEPLPTMDEVLPARKRSRR
jgi:hypothetical protein